MPVCNRSALALFLFGVLAPGVLPAQEPHLVRDINKDPGQEPGFASREVLAGSGGFFYSFDDGIHGPELWRSDFDGSKAFLVRDLCPGPCGSSPRELVELAGKVYFFADDGATGLELWRTDGTPGGTTFLRDLCPGPCPGRPDAGSSPVVAGDALFFRARDGSGQVGLWTSDGTRAGTQRVADVCHGCNAGIFDLTAIGGSVFFRADDGVHGIEVWSSDGVATAMLRDDCPGACSSGPAKDQPDMFTPYGDAVFYWQLVPGNSGGWRLRWTAGEEGLAYLFSSPPRLAVVGSSLLFTAGYCLARIDVPAFTPAVVHNFGDFVGPVTTLGNAIVFQGRDAAHGFELWRSDGTGAGTQLVADTVPGAASGDPQSLVTVAGKLFFTAEQGAALWVSDGTAAGTHRLQSSPAYLAVTRLTPDPLGKRLLFTTGGLTGELWVTDGATKTYSVRRRNSGVPGSADLRALTAFEGSLLFGARKARSENYRLWRSDGTQSSTEILSTTLGAPEDAAPFQGGLVFRNGTEIWTTDGTAGGTRVFLPGFTADTLKVAGDRLLLSGFGPTGPGASEGFEPWISDGTPTGTRLVKDIVPGEDPAPSLYRTPLSSKPRQLTPAGSSIFFTASSPDSGTEVWSSDGTEAGTALLTDLCPGPCSSAPHLRAAFAGQLFFTVEGLPALLSGVAGRYGYLYFRRTGHSSPDPVVFRDHLFFFAEDSTGYESLWSSDGTEGGSMPLLEVSGPDQPRTAHSPIVAGGRLYFTSWTEDAGQELWVSDGTAAGTRLLADVRPGPEGSMPRHLTAAGKLLFFTADDGRTGQELWRTDGTAAGTRRVGDIAPGPASAAPDDLTFANDRLFFIADDGKTGRELWAVDFYARCEPAASRLCLAGGRFEVSVTFLNPLAGGTVSSGTAIPDSDQSGFFWFFGPGNLELVIKVLDGRSENGNFWVFFGALSDVDYTVKVTDRATGLVRTYHNPHGTLCGQADTAGFPDPDVAAAPALAAPVAAPAAGSCAPGSSMLCLRGGRFRVEARWKIPSSGQEGTATAVPRTDESGSFWFFGPGNTELVVKVLDGNLLNGKFWVFYGALSDVEYWLTVTDTVAGATKTYHNPPGSYCGQGDTAAL